MSPAPRVNTKARQLRVARGWGRAEMIVASGLSENAVKRIEQGKDLRKMSLEKLLMYAYGLGVPPVKLWPFLGEIPKYNDGDLSNQRARNLALLRKRQRLRAKVMAREQMRRIPCER